MENELNLLKDIRNIVEGNKIEEMNESGGYVIDETTSNSFIERIISVLKEKYEGVKIVSNCNGNLTLPFPYKNQEVTFKPMELTCILIISKLLLLQDSISVENHLRESIMDSIIYKLESSIFNTKKFSVKKKKQIKKYDKYIIFQWGGISITINPYLEGSEERINLGIKSYWNYYKYKSSY